MQVRREETHAHGPAQVEPDGHRPGLFGRSRRSYTHAFQSSRLTIFSRSPSTGVPRLSRYVRQQSRSRTTDSREVFLAFNDLGQRRLRLSAGFAFRIDSLGDSPSSPSAAACIWL